MASYDVVIVGAGGMGSAAAYHLARRGARVAVLDQFTPGHDRGSSHGPTRIFRLGYPQPHFVAMAQRALIAWRELEESTETELLRTTGGIDHGDVAVIRSLESALAAAHVRHERVARRDAADRWPQLTFDGDVLVHPEAGVLHADAAVRALQTGAQRAGADVRWNARVTAINPATDTVTVTSTTGTLTAECVVLTAGAWLPKLAADLHLDLPALTVTQQQPAYFRTDAPDWPVFIHHRPDSLFYGLPTPGLGVKVGRHGPGLVVDPDDRPPPADDAREELERYVAEWLPGAAPTASRVDSCLYTSTPDEEFVLTRSGRVVVCSACSGHGFKFVPVIGAAVSDLAMG
jgi:sarcosine oxidase